MSILATYRPAHRVIQVVTLREDDGSWTPLVCTNPNSSAVAIIHPFAGRATIEQQDF